MREHAEGWTVLGRVVLGDRVLTVTAARVEDGIGVVATWDWTPAAGWRLACWGCTEDHAGDDDGGAAERLPQAPPVGAEVSDGA